jgi:hypothetical protein
MLRLFVDFNARDFSTPGIDPALTVLISLDHANRDVDRTQFYEGKHVIVFEPNDIEAEAILRLRPDGSWVGEIIEGTFRDLPDAPGD